MKRESTWQFEVSAWKEAPGVPNYRRRSHTVTAGELFLRQLVLSIVSLEKSVFCEGSHTSQSCSKAQRLSFVEKRNLAVKRLCCFACLKPGHIERRCRAVLRCVLCNGRHVPVMCMPTEKVSMAK
jgi:hypothetical protein